MIDEGVAEEAKTILSSVVTSGTGTKANIGDPAQWGKTGTTENNGDAWFCGATDEVTACVWVGHADSTTPMTTEFAGGPVDGGTFPALIWAGVISAWEDIQAVRAAERESGIDSDDDSGSTYVPSAALLLGAVHPGPVDFGAGALPRAGARAPRRRRPRRHLRPGSRRRAAAGPAAAITAG